ncbi:MAG: hypothetical protein IT463_11065 [Planctomycetes bacterium]|nr:hypothetical protein [Planctomycetota bacterium]
MRTAPLLAFLLLPLVLHVDNAKAQQAPAKGVLPAAVRAEVVTKYFDGTDPGDEALAGAITLLELPASLRAHIEANEWEKGQLERFAADKLFFLLRGADGKTRALHYRAEKLRNTRELTPARERVLRRLYSDAAFTAQPDAALREAAARADLYAATVLEAAIAQVQAGKERTLDDKTLERARANLKAAANGGRELAAGLLALKATPHAVEAQWAGVWLVSRLDAMTFRREEGKGDIGDLQAMDARCFYENVLYAVKARRELPWGAPCSDHDFLQHVLSPRGTGEPLQRWRRHFFEAMAPELAEFKAEDAATAAEFAGNCAYDFYQYEGDTTWEDFGMLSALAVHEGRCEDCSNVENCFKRALGLPAAQAFTPWWAHSNGNHAWTVIPSLDGGRNGDGAGAAKVYLKHWDGLDDITDKNTKVTSFSVAMPGATAPKAALRVWNHDEWRVVARADLKDGVAAFEKVGCSRDFVFNVQAEGAQEKLLLVRKGGEMLELAAGEMPAGGTFKAQFGKSCALGEFKAEAEYKVLVFAAGAWAEVPCTRVSTGAIAFEAHPDRLYRLQGEGMADRPFTVAMPEGAFEPEVVKL